MKRTLLEMVQDILNNTDGEEVNSISDTVESVQVANIIRQSYNNLISNIDLPELYDIVQLTPSGDNLLPVLMTKPSNVLDLIWLKYDKRLVDDDTPTWQYLNFLPMEEFLNRQLQYNYDESDIDTMSFIRNSKTFVLPYRNNKAPDFYTTVDEDLLLFDSIDLEIDTTLVGAKTWGWAMISSTFLMEDAYTPPLDSKQFSLLLSESEAEVWSKLHQMENPRAERRARRNWVNTQNTKDNVERGSTYPHFNHLRRFNFGRKTR